MRIVQTPKFERSLKKLPISIIDKVVKRTVLFKNNPFNPLLNTHKLHGKLKDQWSFSIDSRFRILFEFDGEEVIFLDVGDHELYR